MKILMGYDGSVELKKVICDLKSAGLPARGEFMVMTVADWVPLPVVSASEIPAVILDSAYQETYKQQGKEKLREAYQMAHRAAREIKKNLRGWKVSAEAYADSPAWAIVKKSDQWKANLVMVWAHHSNLLGRLLFGGVTQKVAEESFCSVRIFHKKTSDCKSPMRIVIGIDGSSNSLEAVGEVAKRHWKKGTAVHLVSAIEPAMEWSQSRKEKHWLTHLLKAAEKKLRQSDLVVASLLKPGNPKEVLVREAKAWGADMIFVGARGLRGVERFLIGSVSAAVAARAHCAVEIVRIPARSKK